VTNTNAIDAITAAIKPVIAADYAAAMVRGLARMLERFGPTMQGVGNSGSYREWGQINTCCRSVLIDASKPRTVSNVTYEIDEERLAAKSNEYADACCNEWAAKWARKVGELENVEGRYASSRRIVFGGRRAGKLVVIEQTMITNCSPKGVFFHQFPARIYVDGKFTSEKAYSKMEW
jgi:hypothetical protein